MTLQAVLSYMNSMNKLDLTVVGLLRDLQSMIYMINLEQPPPPPPSGTSSSISSGKNATTSSGRLKGHKNQGHLFKKSNVSDSSYVILEGNKTKSTFKSI